MTSTALASRRFALTFVLLDALVEVPLVLERALHHLLSLLSYSLCDGYRIGGHTFYIGTRLARCAWVVAARPRASGAPPTLFAKVLAVWYVPHWRTGVLH